MKKICLLSIPMLLAVSCSVWAQMTAPASASRPAAQPQTSVDAGNGTQQVIQQPVQPQYQQQQIQYVQQPQYVQQSIQAVPVTQSAQQTVTVSGGAAMPVTTIVPAQQQPVTLIDSSTVIEPSAQPMTRTQRREYKAEVFSARLDSLVRSRNFAFYPNSMQEAPEGSIKYIVADYFYFGLFVDSAEIHLPVVNGRMETIEMINFDSAISDFRLYPYQSGVSCTFAMHNNGIQYFVRLVVSTVTGETVLMLVSPDATMRYIGYLTMQKMHDE